MLQPGIMSVHHSPKYANSHLSGICGCCIVVDIVFVDVLHDRRRGISWRKATT